MSATDTALHTQQVAGLYANHHRWLLSWLQRRLDCRHDAADLTHDAFMRIWVGLRPEDVDALREPRAYLTTVARRLLINHYERRSLEQAYLASLHLLPQADAPSPEERAILLETLHELDMLLDTLPARVRTTFLLSQLDGMGYEDIARTLRVSVRTVTRYMAQAFARCLQAMMDHPG